MEHTKCSQSKSSISMPLQQHSWQTINPQMTNQQHSQSIVGLPRSTSGENNLMPTILSNGAVMCGKMGQSNE